jgi:hypothetical protein
MAEIAPTVDRSKVTDVVVQLLRLTVDHKLDWQPRNPSIVSGGSSRIEGVFETTYKGRGLRLYRSLPGSASAQGILGTDVWTVVLEMLDEKGRPAWTFPSISALRDLYSVVSYQGSGVEDFLDDVLSEVA